MANVLLEFEGQLAVVTLERPERRNALSLDLMLELTACLGSMTTGAFSTFARN